MPAPELLGNERHRLLDRPMAHLHDAIGSVAFSLWLPVGARRSSHASSDIAYLLDADGDTLELVVELVRSPDNHSIANQVAFLTGLGDEVRRVSAFVDGYMVTSIGNIDLNVVRQLRVGDRALQCWAQVRRRTESLATRILWAEAICSSLAIS